MGLRQGMLMKTAKVRTGHTHANLSSDPPVTAAQRGLMLCQTCGLLCIPSPLLQSACPRCASHLSLRKPNSIARTWAFLIAACILYIPANLLPIMQTRSLFEAQEDTIMSGIVFLWVTGSWPLAVLVFFASIVVPSFKLIALTGLTVSVQRRYRHHRQFRARVYRLVEVIGRWSMLDIYVVALLVALVQIKSLAIVNAGPGAAAFGAVVVLTIFAAESFDPRLIWDFIDSKHD